MILLGCRQWVNIRHWGVKWMERYQDVKSENDDLWFIRRHNLATCVIPYTFMCICQHLSISTIMQMYRFWVNIFTFPYYIHISIWQKNDCKFGRKNTFDHNHIWQMYFSSQYVIKVQYDAKSFHYSFRPCINVYPVLNSQCRCNLHWADSQNITWYSTLEPIIFVENICVLDV